MNIQSSKTEDPIEDHTATDNLVGEEEQWGHLDQLADLEHCTVAGVEDDELELWSCCKMVPVHSWEVGEAIGCNKDSAGVVHWLGV